MNFYKKINHQSFRGKRYKCFLLAYVLTILFCNAQNLLLNGSFEEENSSWNNLMQDGAIAHFSYIGHDVYEGQKAIETNVSALGANSWSVQSIHAGWESHVGNTYKVTLYAKADVDGKKIRIVNQGSHFMSEDLTLSRSWKPYSWNFTALESNTQFKIHFIETGIFSIDAVNIEDLTGIPSPPVAPSLRELAHGCNLNIGTAVSDGPLQTEKNYQTVLSSQFNMVTAENAMKMEVIKPSEAGDYNFFGADRLVNYATENDMKVRGHAILWHSQLPEWFESKAWTRETLLHYLKEYITTVVGRYKGKIQEWDIANEMVSDDNGHPLRNSVWLSVVGVSVLDSAFKWAHETDPDAKLFYNDYSAEGMNSKSDVVYNLVRDLKNRGVPIHGVGLQAHRNYDEAISESSSLIEEMDQNIKRLGALGLKVAITELDLAIPTPVTNNDFYLQAASFGNMLQLALNNADIVETFVMWGFTDKYSWIPSFWENQKDSGLIFDRNYQPKLAHSEMVSVLNQNCAQIPSGLNFKTNEINFSIYPNPFSDQVNISSSSNVQYTIYSYAGSEIASGIVNGNLLLGKDFSAGKYVIRIICAEGVKVAKFEKF